MWIGLNVRVARLVEWLDRNDHNATESFNETILFTTEHLPHIVGTWG